MVLKFRTTGSTVARRSDRTTVVGKVLEIATSGDPGDLEGLCRPHRGHRPRRGPEVGDEDRQGGCRKPLGQGGGRRRPQGGEHPIDVRLGSRGAGGLELSPVLEIGLEAVAEYGEGERLDQVLDDSG